MAESAAMWESLVAQIRRAGPRKVLIVVVATVVVVVLAFGNNVSDNASAHTLSHAQAAGMLGSLRP
jgi:hypothetical protein